MLHELGSRLVIHTRLPSIALHTFVGDPPDPPPVVLLVQLVLFDLAAEVCADELGVLDDARVHVNDIKAAVRRVAYADRSEERIRRSNELRLRVRVSELRQPIRHDDLRLTHEAADWFGEEEIPARVIGKAIATVDFDAGGGREVIERAFGHAAA